MKIKKWLIIANTVEALIYQIEGRSYTLIKTLMHRQSQLKSIDLVSDKPGRYKTEFTTRGQYAPSVEPHEKEHELFAKEVADFLDSGRKQHQYESIILCAEPHFYGLIKKACNPTVCALIKKSIEKDYLPLPEAKRNHILEAIVHNPLGF